MEPSISKFGPLAARTVHIKIHPTPSSFNERREVIRVLEQFGEVSMFRSLKYHPLTPTSNAFLSIFASSATAKEIISNSPLRFRLQTPTISSSQPLKTPPHLSSSISSHLTKPFKEEASEKTFELHISPSNFNHEKHISSQPLYGPFLPIHSRYSYISAHLQRVIPSSLWSKGLADWETDPVRWRKAAVGGRFDVDINEEIQQGEGKKNTDFKGSGAFVKLRAAERFRRRKEGEIPNVMKGLKMLREQKIKVEENRTEGLVAEVKSIVIP